MRSSKSNIYRVLKKIEKNIKKGVDILIVVLYNNFCVTDEATNTEVTQTKFISGCGSACLERLVWAQEGAGSNPVTPMLRGCSSMVEH